MTGADGGLKTIGVSRQSLNVKRENLKKIVKNYVARSKWMFFLENFTKSIWIFFLKICFECVSANRPLPLEIKYLVFLCWLIHQCQGCYFMRNTNSSFLMITFENQNSELVDIQKWVTQTLFKNFSNSSRTFSPSTGVQWHITGSKTIL